MSTVRDLLTDSMMLIGALGANESIKAGDAAFCLRRLNSLLSTWSTQGLMVYTTNREVFPLTIGKQSYTLGAGGDLDTERPVWFNQASIIPTASAPTLEIPIKIDSDDDWQQVSIKSIASNFPLDVHPLGNYPLNTLEFWPIPTQTCSVVLYLPQQLDGFTDVNATVSFPPAYEEAIVNALAIHIAPAYGIQVPPDVRQAAIAAKDSIRAQNLVTPVLGVDSAYCGMTSGPSANAIKSKGWVVD